MRSHYKSKNIVATSARSLSYFKDLKNTSNKDFPMTADKFLSTHVLMINGAIKLAKADLKSQEQLNPDDHE